MNYWLVKSEPYAYSWDDFTAAGISVWDGVRNYQARNNLQAMKLNDSVLFYHSNQGMCVVGLARVSKESYPDPTINDPRWVVVELEPIEAFKRPVTLKEMKANARLQNIALIKHSRLSVMPVGAEEFDIILNLGNQE